ncbi:hypothetical protein ACOMHN_044111 [Nucella lapillus]
MEDHGYRRIRMLKSGGFGKVMEVTETRTGKKRALKLCKPAVQLVSEQEINLNKYLLPDFSDFIARFRDHFTIPEGTCMVFELMEGGDLHGWLRGRIPSGVGIRTFRILATRMFGALEYLDKKSILHGDIKTNNFLLADPADPSTLKLGDFGLAEKMSASDSPKVYFSTFQVLNYRAPEVMLKYPTNQILAPDMWGVGCTLLHVLLGDMVYPFPFGTTEVFVMLERYLGLLGRLPEVMLSKSLMSSLLVDLKEPSKYPKDSKELAHFLIGAKPSWMRSEAIYVSDILRRTLDLNPDVRIRPGAALKHPFIKQT